MKILTSREVLLPALLAVNGVVEKKQTMPILSNILFSADPNGDLHIISTDLDIEMKVLCKVNVITPGSITLPARKLLDICRNLSDEQSLEIDCAESSSATLKAGRGRYKLQSLPANQFPDLDDIDYHFEFSLAQYQLQTLLHHTQFAMASQDVRYYLNGLLFELSPGQFRAVATDSHRITLSETAITFPINETAQFILPRKAIVELYRFLSDDESLINCRFAHNHMSFSLPNVMFTTKLIDAQYANYERVLPDPSDPPTYDLTVPRAELQQVLTRVAILSHEKIKGVSLTFEDGTLMVQSFNSENEEAEEVIDIDYQGERIELSFNGSYVTDYLNTSNAEFVRFFSGKINDSTVIQDANHQNRTYVVMPMKY